MSVTRSTLRLIPKFFPPVPPLHTPSHFLPLPSLPQNRKTKRKLEKQINNNDDDDDDENNLNMTR